MSVLIVCGNASAMGALAQSLNQDGHDVVTAATGQRALDILKCNQTINTVVVDRFIPDMTPFNLFQAYNTYRELQWPGCETSRGTPAFILSHPLEAQDEASHSILDAVSSVPAQSVRRSAPHSQCQPSTQLH